MPHRPTPRKARNRLQPADRQCHGAAAMGLRSRPDSAAAAGRLVGWPDQPAGGTRRAADFGHFPAGLS
jgi:hypothetical protein